MNLINGNNIVSPLVTLVGFASMPADTFAEGPQAGQNISANGRTGPFPSQPVQGFSGVQFASDRNSNSFWFLSDNGFGSKANSSDYLLRLYQVRPDFITNTGNGLGNVNIERFVQLRDPNNLIPFAIVNEGTANRDLTGSDFDIESFVIDANGDIWVGDEFGPFLLHFAADGTLLEPPIATALPLNTLNGQVPIIIGHRGASGLRPEHTLEAYQLAIDNGADFIEPDLVITKDGVLIARHENVLATVQLNPDGTIFRDLNGQPLVVQETTNVASLPQFADRLTVKIIDGDPVGGWFSEDFTLAEIKQLRARERIPQIRPDNVAFNDLYEIPTLAEVIQLVQTVEAQTGKQIGIYPETKHPTFFAKEGNYLDGTPIEQSLGFELISTLTREAFTDPQRLFIQSFELANLIELQNEILPSFAATTNNPEIINIPLVQLFGDTDDAFINDRGGGFSVPYDIVYNYSTLSKAEADNLYGALATLVPQFGADITGDGIPDTTYQDLATPEVFNYLGQNYAEGIGPWKNSFVLRTPLPVKVDGNGDGIAEVETQLTGQIRPYIDWAHNAGMQVHPYTLRNEERYLTLNLDGTFQNAEAEFLSLIKLGVDGLFTDFPGTGAPIANQFQPVFAPDNPRVLSGEVQDNLRRSRGFEGMAFSPQRQTIYPLLEGVVTGDPDGALRIYKYDISLREYTDELAGFYPLEDPTHAIGDFTPINNEEFLVIERDSEQGSNALFKKIFKINLSQKDARGFVAKEEIADLLNINDPDDLNRDGSQNFDFPFVTIENVLVIDEHTILVANDNNYPFSNGRGTDIDNTEIILLQLPKRLNLDPTLLNLPSQNLVNIVEIDRDPQQLLAGLTYDIGGAATQSITTRLAADVLNLGVEAVFDNLVGFYEIVDTNGAIDTNNDGIADLTPTQDGYAQFAITNRISNWELRAGSSGDPNFNTTVQQFGEVIIASDRMYAPFVIANGGQVGFDGFIANELAENSVFNNAAEFVEDLVAYFAYVGANPDGVRHIRSLGQNSYGFEDLPSNLVMPDNDFNDATFKFAFSA